MHATEVKPRLAVIVANNITGDSRVQKVALVAARDGWDVTLVGRSTTKKVQESTLGPVKVVRVPVQDHYRRYVSLRLGRSMRRRITQAGLPNRTALAGYGAAHRAWLLKQDVLITTRAGGGALLKPVRRARVKASEVIFQFRKRLWSWEDRRTPERTALTGDWRLDWPAQVEFDLAVVPVLRNLKPDVIHSNDITTMSTAAHAVARLCRQGHRTSWLCDVHEYVRGVEWPRPEQASVFRTLEREFIRCADAITTVSPELAEILRDEYRLSSTPVVVRNAPIRETVGAGLELPSVRQAAGVPDGIPMLVYAGWIGPDRGLGTAVSALPMLPDCHLAIVAGQQNDELKALLDSAVRLGVRGRVHVVPYVAQHMVPDYLSSADLGLICFKHKPNNEVSLPTKVPEYLHAGLPMVVSDVRTVRQFVETHRLGEVFPAEEVEGFVDAVKRALSCRAELAARITPELLSDLSWESQAVELLKEYRRIAPRVPASPCPDFSWTVVEQTIDAEEPANAKAVTPASAPRNWRTLVEPKGSWAATEVRVGIGPANYAGQGAGFATAICRHRPDVSAEVFMYRGPRHLGFPADFYVNVGDLNSPNVQMDLVRRVLGRYTHLIADAFRPVFGHLNGEDIAADLPLLRSARVRVALLGHGNEIRHPLHHLQRHEYSLFHDAPAGMVEKLLALTERNHRIAAESGLPIFVTTPDLLADLPTATWTPLVIDVDAWRCDRPVMQRPVPVVLHAPSNRWTKGTDRIMPVLEGMHERGTIELRLIEGVAWTEMRDLVQGADVVIDQFTTGAYGTLSCEAMAAGRLVIAHISDAVRALVVPDLPIIDATPATLRNALEELLDDRTRARKIGLASTDFTARYHGGAYTARVLDSFLTVDGAK
jgi:glycosyltransferase involved in cell wall biosynthesis